MANYYTQYSFTIENITPEEELWFNKRIEQDCETEDYPLYASAIFDDEPDGSRSLWIHDDTGGSGLDVLAEMLQDFLASFRPNDHVAFSWADTCSKPRIDSFGGGALFIASGNILWMNTYDWITEQVVRMKGSSGNG